jgi:hypothetical protein
MKSRRHARLLSFQEMLDAIQLFVVQKDENDALRGLVCGIYWFDHGIAINIHQLRSLIPKCKSSINGSLQRLGFTVNLRHADANSALTRIFPTLRNNASELRKWTIRMRESHPAMEEEARPLFVVPLEGLAKPSLSVGEGGLAMELESDAEIAFRFAEFRWPDGIAAELFELGEHVGIDIGRDE